MATAPKKKTATKAVAKTADTENLPVEAYDYGADAGAGYETTTADDVSISFLQVLQALSPQLRKNDAAFVAGAQAGMMFDTVSGQLYEELNLLPCYIDKTFVAWAKRDDGDKGGGPYGRFSHDSQVVQDAIAANGGEQIGGDGLFTTINGKERVLVETHYVYCLVLDENGEEAVDYIIVPFSSTKLSVKKRWMGAQQKIKGVVRAPLYAFRSHFTTVEEENQKGAFYNFDIKPLGETWRAALVPPGHKLLDTARAFAESVRKGERTANYESEHAAAPKGGGAASDADDEIPF